MESMPADDIALHTHRSPTAGRASRAPFMVLFIDPNQQRAEVLAHSLRSTCVVAIVPTARAAADVIKTRVPELLVTDLDLPDATGIGFLASLHNTVATRHMLLMVITARATLGDKIAAFQVGADDYLVRPVDPDTFFLRVQLLSRFRRHFPQ
jgi:DNA-binding response OmpR family regulator